MNTIQRLVSMLLAAAVLGACATANDGGIVGTGNRIDCDTARKEGSKPLPPECS